MATLTPVDNDPFATPSGTASPKLTPVDHDPFATTGSGAAAASSSPAGQDLGTTALWNKPANVGWDDYLIAHLANAVKPLSGIADPHQNANEALAFGSGLSGGLSGFIPGVRERTAQAEQQLDPQTRFALEGAGYLVGPGKLGMAKGIAADIAPAGSGFLRGIVGNVVGSSAEGASANYVSALGHGATPAEAEKQGVTGAVIGAPVGALSEIGGRMFAPAGPKPPEVGAPASTDATGVPRAPTGMYAAKETGYAPLDSLYFDTHGDAINRAQTAIRQVRDPQGKGAPLGIPSDVNSILTDKNGLANHEVTGRTIQQASRDLRGTGDWTGHRYADALDNTLRYDTPSAGGQAGEGWNAKQAGDLWYQRINDLERLDEPTAANVKQTQAFYSDPQSPQAQALARLQSAMRPSFNWYRARHLVGPAVGAAVGGVEDLFNPEDHHNPWLNVGSRMLESTALFEGLPALAKARPQGPLNAARYTIGTGQPYIQPSNAGPLGDRLRAIIFGNRVGERQP